MADQIMYRIEINIHEKELCAKLFIYKNIFQLLRITARNSKTFQLLHIFVKRFLVLVTSKEFLVLTE